MVATVFTPLTKQFGWVQSTTGEGGVALPPGEVETGATVGIRADGDAARSPGVYQYFIPIDAGVSVCTLAQVLAKGVPQGANYWAAVLQTDALNGSPATSNWTTEVPFSLPFQVVKPASPTAFSVS